MTQGPDMVLKQGFLYKKRERSSAALLRKPWQSGYFVLKKCSSYSGLLLDEYRDASLRVAKQTLFLDTVKHVGPVNTARSKQYAFQVVVLGRSPLFFACDNEILRAEWIGVFSRYTEELTEPAFTHGRTSPEGGPSGSARHGRAPPVSGMYVDMKPEEASEKHPPDYKGYQVVIQKTPLSEDNNLQGSYVLCVAKTRISLKQIDGKEYILSWPLTQLRGFKSHPELQLVVLETGRRCHFGKGRLSLQTRFAELIVRDIREAISTDSISTENSSDSETEAAHPAVRRSRSDQHCNVTVSVRPRRIHSERVINQVDVGRAANSSPCLSSMGKAAGKTIHPVQQTSGPNAALPSVSAAGSSVGEEIFRFDGSQRDNTASTGPGPKAANWKTSSTFGKTMTESRSDTESFSNDVEDKPNRYPYVDIIHEDEGETPITSDEASTLLAQVVADLTEPQKRNNFVKSKSTGGIQGKPPEINEARRASAPAVGSREFIASAATDVDAQGNALNTQWKLRLEKINEVSFTDVTDGEQHSSPGNSISENGMADAKANRPRSLSELLATELELPPRTPVQKSRSKTVLGLTQSNFVCSLTDLSSSKHRGLKAALSLSPSLKLSHQFERDICFSDFAGSKVPSFPKSSVVKAVESAGAIDNNRAKLSMSPLPPEFHNTNASNNNENDTESLSPVSPIMFDSAPPRPPRGAESKVGRSKSGNRSSPPPLPERNLSQPILSSREQFSTLKSNSLGDSGFFPRPYVNTPPKVHPRSPKALPMTSSSHDENFSHGPQEDTSPPPRPPKPESLSAALKKSSVESRFAGAGFHNNNGRRFVSEKRPEGYPWEIDRQMGSDAFRDDSLQLGHVKRPIVTVTPPWSPELQRPHAIMRAMSRSDPDISKHLSSSMTVRASLSSTRSSPES